MKRIDQGLQAGGWLTLLALILGLGTGCDATVNSFTETTPENATRHLSEMDLVKAVEMTIDNPGSAKEEQYVLHVTLNTEAPLRWPEAFHILGMQNDGGVTRLEDNGMKEDVLAGDRTYSAKVDRSCLEGLDTSQWVGKDIISLTLSCEIDFISPGAECEGEGVCPESASRSFLWGLIEYEVDVVTCWCFQGCNVEFELSLGKVDPAPAIPSYEPI